MCSAYSTLARLTIISSLHQKQAGSAEVVAF